MLTPFGKEVRKYRIDRVIKLKDMADGINVPPSYLSAIETGRKNATDKVAKDIATYLKLSKEQTESLISLAKKSNDVLTINISGINDRSKDLAICFARKLEQLPEKEVKNIFSILDKAGKN